ncbi:hypothetical protein JW826_03160 [Candidatus Woesearchaeota archaeon]|nr:hypothetical protein [Candidatus Woesearchaeota archaeon]
MASDNSPSSRPESKSLDLLPVLCERKASVKPQIMFANNDVFFLSQMMSDYVSIGNGGYSFSDHAIKYQPHVYGKGGGRTHQYSILKGGKPCLDMTIGVSWETSSDDFQDYANPIEVVLRLRSSEVQGLYNKMSDFLDLLNKEEQSRRSQ